MVRNSAKHAMLAAGLAAGLVTALQACGVKGPLVPAPKPESPAATPAAAPTPNPAPGTSGSENAAPPERKP